MSEKIELDELQVRDIETLAGYLTIEKIADYLGISEKTFRNIKDRDERVLTAYKRGVSRAEGMASNNIRKFMQYDKEEGEEKPNIARLQMKLDATKFYLNTKSKWSKKEDKKIKFDIPEGATPIEILNKVTGEIRDGNITLSEIKQLIELAQVTKELLSSSDNDSKDDGTSFFEILNEDELKQVRSIVDMAISRKNKA